MIKPVKSILFTTNLSQNSAEAFNHVISLAVRYQANIIILHVMEKIPDYAEARLKGLLGEEKWEEISKSHEDSARQVLIGKKSSNNLIREALDQFCIDAGIESAECGDISREIVIRDGDVVEEILDQASAYNSDLIVMAARQGIISRDTSIGSTIKGVLRKSRVPVLVVPPEPGKK
ncbi:MAG: universal stress protein [Desulfobacteraceae bacterium]|nr:universal stress protein [Desulfobacteraceae bacterium]